MKLVPKKNSRQPGIRLKPSRSRSRKQQAISYRNVNRQNQEDLERLGEYHPEIVDYLSKHPNSRISGDTVYSTYHHSSGGFTTILLPKAQIVQPWQCADCGALYRRSHEHKCLPTLAKRIAQIKWCRFHQLMEIRPRARKFKIPHRPGYSALIANGARVGDIRTLLKSAARDEGRDYRYCACEACGGVFLFLKIIPFPHADGVLFDLSRPDPNSFCCEECADWGNLFHKHTNFWNAAHRSACERQGVIWDGEPIHPQATPPKKRVSLPRPTALIQGAHSIKAYAKKRNSESV